jgi:hypothetical protein
MMNAASANAAPSAIPAAAAIARTAVNFCTHSAP